MRLPVCISVALVIVAACEPHVAHYPSRPEDRAAWTNAPIIELETHEKFSTMQYERRVLSDGSEMWLYPECSSGKTTCRGGGAVVGQAVVGGTRCTTDDPKCCYHQFFVRDGVVERYEARGEGYVCRSNCLTRPKTVRAACER